ncbi:uncharacterized protein METZ01_LOCUS446912, partial [marine metagenome]
MQLTDSIPEAIQRKLDTCLDVDEEIRIALETDVDDSGKFNPRWLVTTTKRVMVLDLNGSGQDLAVPLEDIQKVHVEPLVGGGSMEVNTYSDSIPLISYSQSRAERFVEASRGIE